MNLTPEQMQIGRDNFNEAVGFTRRDFIKGTAAAGTGLGALYFGYQQLQGDPVRVGFIGTGDEGGVLLAEHPEDYMHVVAVADIRPTNLKRAILGDGKPPRIGLTAKLGADQASQVRRFTDHTSLIAAKDELGLEAVVIAVPLSQHAPIAKQAIEAGLHVLTEKLMAHNITECKELILAARQRELLLAVGHQRHYSVLYDNANQLVQKGLLGDIKHIRAQWHRNNSYPNRDSWRKRIPKEDQEALEKTVTQYG